MLKKLFLLVLEHGYLRHVGPYDTVGGRLSAAREFIDATGSDVWWLDTYADGSITTGSCKNALAMRAEHSR